MLFDTINLDDMSVDPTDYDIAAKTLELLAYYAKMKACAMRHRLEGRIGSALAAERLCDSRYAQLPEWAKW
jgi:hypothetical protein